MTTLAVLKNGYVINRASLEEINRHLRELHTCDRGSTGELALRDLVKKCINLSWKIPSTSFCNSSVILKQFQLLGFASEISLDVREVVLNTVENLKEFNLSFWTSKPYVELKLGDPEVKRRYHMLTCYPKAEDLSKLYS